MRGKVQRRPATVIKKTGKCSPQKKYKGLKITELTARGKTVTAKKYAAGK